ncbi:peptidoglycan DD-metalloendopeptidase family protein [Halobacillus seohaensis]|uniref:Peptidoglycan DD-metalloendopeptidase family protein n=1 Tax=Halobacillus seohaensis TaxID=447421 RepID=A0ABW2EFJ2_9BACI
MKETKGLWKKASVIALLAMGLSFGTAYAEENLETFFHVYVGDKHIGVVKNKENAQSYVQQQLDKVQEQHEDYQLEPLEEVTYVSEKMFAPSVETDQTLRKLGDSIDVGVEAVGLTVESQTIAYLPSEADAEDVVQKFKEQYVDPEDLKEVETRANDEKIELKGSTVMEVQLTNEISQEKEVVEASEVTDVTEAVEILKKGTYQETTSEVVGKIAPQYNLSQEQMMTFNDEYSIKDQSQSDQEVNVADFEPWTEVFIKKEGIKKENIPYKTEVVKTDDLVKGETEIKQEGQDGEKEIHYYKHMKNDRIVDEGTIEEKEVSAPVKEIVVQGTKVISSKGTGEFEWPAVEGTITSEQGKRWGSFHKGIDIAGVSNRTIKAADNGKIIEAGKDGAYGNKVIVDHNNGYKTIYAHLESIDVSVGDTVEKGSTLGKMGTTGRSTGVHLHFEVYKNGSLEDPLEHI